MDFADVLEHRRDPGERRQLPMGPESRISACPRGCNTAFRAVLPALALPAARSRVALCGLQWAQIEPSIACLRARRRPIRPSPTSAEPRRTTLAGSGTGARALRISPPGKFAVWIFR